MLCIRGRQHPAHTGLVAGQVYDVTPFERCHGKAVHAEGSVFVRPVTLRCWQCDRVIERKYLGHVPWGPDRFVPWNPPKVSVEEVTALYHPSPLPEVEKALLEEMDQRLDEMGAP